MVRYDLSEYIASHGREPAGVGLWRFRVDFLQADGRTGEAELSRYGNLLHARKEIARVAKATYGHTSQITVYVLP